MDNREDISPILKKATLGQTNKIQKNRDLKEYQINHRKGEEGMERMINSESVRNLGTSPISSYHH